MSNRNIIMSSFKSSRDIQKKEFKIQIPRYKVLKVGIFRISPI